MRVRVLLLSVAVILYMGIASGPILAADVSGGILLAQESGASDSSSEEDDLLKELDTELGGADSGSDEDLLKDLDMDVVEAAQPEKGKEIERPIFIKDLAKGFEGTLIPRVMVQLVNFEGEPGEERDAKDIFYDYRLEGETKVAREKYIFNVTGWAEGGNQEGTYSRATQFMTDNEHRRRHLEINELYFTLTSETFDVTLGRKIVLMGLSTLYIPTDRVSPRDLNDPMDPKDYGIWLASIDYFHKETTLTLTAIPFFSPNKNPDRTSIWTGKGAGADYDFAGGDDGIGSDATIEDEFPPPGEVGGLAKAKTVFKGWDLFLAVFNGFSLLPVLEEKTAEVSGGGFAVDVPAEYKKHYPRVINISGGFSTTHKDFEFHGEGVYQRSHSGKDDNYMAYVGGITYTNYDFAEKIGHERIDITLEYGGEWVDATQSHPDYQRSSEGARPTDNNGFGRIEFKYDEDLKWQCGINYEISDKGWSQGMLVEYKLTDDVKVKVSGELFDGGNDSYFEKWEDNDRVICQLEYSF